MEKLSSGFDFIDFVSKDGLNKKSLYSFMSNDKTSRSIWMSNIAHQLRFNGKNVFIATLGLSKEQYLELGLDYNEKSNTTKASFDKLKPIPGKITVEEFSCQTSIYTIESHISISEIVSKIKYDVIIIDSLELLKDDYNTHDFIDVNHLNIKKYAQKNNWCVLINSELGMERREELKKVSDVVFEIIQDPLMHINEEFKLLVLESNWVSHKGCYKKFYINYNYLIIAEATDSPILTKD